MADPIAEAAATAAGGPLGFAVSHWFLVVQGGAVIVAIVLAWVCYLLAKDNSRQRDSKEQLLKDRIAEARLDTETEKEATAAMVEAMTENTAAQTETNRRLRAIEVKLGVTS